MPQAKKSKKFRMKSRQTPSYHKRFGLDTPLEAYSKRALKPVSTNLSGAFIKIAHRPERELEPSSN